jgi:imidazolonepropionase-like amidohydrolase
MKDVVANVGMFHDRGVVIVVGTDTGNPYVFPGYSVHQELDLLVRAGLTPMEALEAGTRRAAEMIGAETRSERSKSGSEPTFSSSMRTRWKPSATRAL